MSNTILVVDDDQNICELIKMYLEDDFNVEIANDGRDIQGKLRNTSPILVILDVMLPVKNGWELCREIRKEWDIPIIMLTAKGDETDKVLGLELGADDYITKPFSPRELTARVKAVLRRSSSGGGNAQIIRFPGLVLDIESRRVKVNGEPVELTPKEFELLFLMASNSGRVFSRESLLEKIWGYDFDGDTRAVDSQIKRLRKKLEILPDNHSYIHTVWGIGYKFEVQP
ncbi:response regulator transcription factor [Phosphitispora sp. TUW77]|uniref:response regulator transcription factor n=1 Tax=Phosphitispora sp. TUW77 TaxID=3152361 RepID=UPI003AB473A5